MQKDKHNIYSKEELLKIIKEGKNAPADMDEFELEALEGLKLLDNTIVLNKLNKEVDEIITREKKKESQRKTIYYFSAAASLLLLVSLLFLFKNEVVVKNEKVVAEVEKPKEENLHLDLAPPAQAEAATTYEAKEPEQEKTPKKEITVLADGKAKQKQNEAELKNDNLASDIRSEQGPIINAKNDNGYLTQDIDRKGKEKDVATNQTFGTASADLKADNLSEQQNQNRSDKVNKSKKVVAAIRQPAMVYQSKDDAQTADAYSGTPKVDSKKAEEKTKSDLFYANSAAKSKMAKNYKEATFINGDSAFAAYVKQNLKISSENNSGIIVVAFLVNKDGTTSNIETLKSLNECEICSKDVIDFIKSIKKWQPAIENGKAISAPKKISIQYN